MTPRVLVVTNMWPSSNDPAFGVFVAEQVHALRELGLPVDVAAIDGRRSALAYARAIPGLRRRLRRREHDLVHAHHALSGLALLIARQRSAAPPWFLTHHGIEVFEGWQAPLSRWLSGRADRTLVVSAPMADHLGLGPESVLPMGVDLARFVPGDRLAARRALELPGDRPLVAWIGTDRPEKRLWLARDAVAALRESGCGADLLVVAGRDHAEVPLWLAASDALLLTSTREGAPVVVKEALACNRPVVSTDVGDVADLVRDLPGCYVTAATAEALADGLRRALAHGPTAGRDAVRAYDTRVLAARLARMYDDAARRP